MAIIEIKQKGGFTKIEKFLEKNKKLDMRLKLSAYGEIGRSALASATPIDTGATASSWGYEVEESGTVTTLTWYNSNVNNNVNIAYILDQGHGTGTGGFVPGRHYIEPAIQPAMDRIADEHWKEVTSS